LKRRQSEDKENGTLLEDRIYKERGKGYPWEEVKKE
jgi:hypothetical protein